MKWPFVHRARLEAAEGFAEWHRLNAESWKGTANNAMAELLRMKRDGFVAAPPRTPTTPGVPYRGQDVVYRDKLISQFIAETPGLSPEKAAEAADQVLGELL